MKIDTVPNLSALYLITIGASLLAIPGSLGGLFLVVGLYDGLLSFAQPSYIFGSAIPLAGFFLLFGYFATIYTKKFNKNFWIVSSVYNLAGFLLGMWLLLTFVGSANGISVTASIVAYVFWCLTATISSFYYYRFATKVNEFNFK